MAQGRRRDAWERTSWVLAKLHNTHYRNRLTPVQCNPLERKAEGSGRIRITRDNIYLLKRVVPPRKRRKPVAGKGGGP
jgi:hypothetical protein